MDDRAQLALEVARRMLQDEEECSDSASHLRLLTDLAEMIRQNMHGEELLAENSHWLWAHGNTVVPVHY